MLRGMCIAATLVVAACGGSSSPVTPTVPAPISASDACAALGTASSSLAILSGEQCGVANSPVVKINLKSPSGSSAGICTGTVIGRRAVLTAAHCLDDDVGSAQIWFGVVGTLEIPAAAFHFYPGYSFNAPNVFDVGVLLFDEDLPRTPVSILTSRQAQVGETAIVAGWGRDENSSTTQLRAGSTKISAVSATYLETLHAPPSASVCSGDSGGPILLQQSGIWTIGGITSATSGVACNTGTNFYQAVFNPNVRNFIRQYVPTVGER